MFTKGPTSSKSASGERPDSQLSGDLSSKCSRLFLMSNMKQILRFGLRGRCDQVPASGSSVFMPGTVRSRWWIMSFLTRGAARHKI